MKTVPVIFGCVIFAAAAGGAVAESMRCQGQLLQDDQIKPPTQAQVRELCGTPVSESPGELVYQTAPNVHKVLHFNDAGQLEEITEKTEP